MAFTRRARHLTAGVDSSQYWDFTPGQRVMTKEGFAGVVTEVQDGGYAGQEAYIVELDKGMGGGAYGPSELRSLGRSANRGPRTAARAWSDYPELGSVQLDRPSPELAATGMSPSAIDDVTDDDVDQMAGDPQPHYPHSQARLASRSSELVKESVTGSEGTAEIIYDPNTDLISVTGGWVGDTLINMFLKDPGPDKADPLAGQPGYWPGPHGEAIPVPDRYWNRDEPRPTVSDPTVWARHHNITPQWEPTEEYGYETPPGYEAYPNPYKDNGQRQAHFNPHAAGLDPIYAARDLAFEVTATWADVRAKAKRLEKEGKVRIISSDGMNIAAEVRGEHNLYRTRLTRMGKSVAWWECGCPWSAYSWGRTRQWKKFEGRMCSHALGTLFQAQHDEMFGGQIHERSEAPSWRWDPTHQPLHPQNYPKPKTTSLQVEAQANSTGVMVAFPLPESLAEALAIPGGEPSEEMHITLAYLGNTEEVDEDLLHQAVANYAAGADTLSGTISGYGTFRGDESAVLVALWDIPGLPMWRELLVHRLDHLGMPVRTNHGFTAHTTIAYTDTPIQVLPTMPPEAQGEVTFDQVVVAYGGDWTLYDLGSMEKAAWVRDPKIARDVATEPRDPSGKWTDSPGTTQRISPTYTPYEAPHGKSVGRPDNPHASEFSRLSPEYQAGILKRIREESPNENLGPLTPERMVKNLKLLYHHAKKDDPAAIKEAMSWYGQAHDVGNKVAERLGLDRNRGSGLVAALSPQLDWDENVAQAHYLSDQLAQYGSKPVPLSPEALSLANTKLSEVSKGTLGPIKSGMTLGELPPLAAASVLYAKGKTDDRLTTGKVIASGRNAKAAWTNGMKNIAKFVRIARGDDPNEVLSGHKVRSFFNNINDPEDTTGHHDITMDTHAVSAASMAMMGAGSQKLKRFFDSGGSAKENVHGAYALMADVYREANRQLAAEGEPPMTPNQFQAAIWIHWRSMTGNIDRNPNLHIFPVYKAPPKTRSHSAVELPNDPVGGGLAPFPIRLDPWYVPPGEHHDPDHEPQLLAELPEGWPYNVQEDEPREAALDAIAHRPHILRTTADLDEISIWSPPGTVGAEGPGRCLRDGRTKGPSSVPIRRRAEFDPNRHPRSGETGEFIRAVNEMHAQAVKDEPAITKLLSGVAEHNHGRMDDLNFKFKDTKDGKFTPGRSLEKLMDYGLKKHQSAQEAKASLGDMLRYTMLLDPEHYSEGVRHAMSELEAAGYKTREGGFKNYWLRHDPYQGINTSMLAPSGQRWELQFHTPESVDVKLHKLHDPYEIARDKSEPMDKRQAAWDQMIKTADDIQVPEGATDPGLGRLVLQPDIEKEIEDVPTTWLQHLNAAEAKYFTSHAWSDEIPTTLHRTFNDVDYEYLDPKTGEWKQDDNIMRHRIFGATDHDPISKEQAMALIGGREITGRKQGMGPRDTPSTDYGMVWDPSAASDPDVRAAKAANWDEVPVTDFDLSTPLHATEGTLSSHSINKVLSGEPLRPGYDPQILLKDGKAYVIDGHHRVAMHLGLGHRTMKAHVMIQPRDSAGRWTSTLNDRPEPALPSTDGSEEDVTDQSHDPMAAPNLSDYGGDVMGTNDDPQAAGKPSPNRADPLGKESRRWIMESSRPQPKTRAMQASEGRMSRGAGADHSDNDIAKAARQHLAQAQFTPAEQAELINEGEMEGVTASNLDALQLEGSHYAELEELLQQADQSGESVLWVGL